MTKTLEVRASAILVFEFLSFVCCRFHEDNKAQGKNQMKNILDQNPNKDFQHQKERSVVMSSDRLTLAECMEILVEPIVVGEKAEAKHLRVAKRMGWDVQKAKRAILGYIKRPYGDDLDKARDLAEQLRGLKNARDEHEIEMRRLAESLRQTDAEFHSSQISAIEHQARSLHNWSND